MNTEMLLQFIEELEDIQNQLNELREAANKENVNKNILRIKCCCLHACVGFLTRVVKEI